MNNPHSASTLTTASGGGSVSIATSFVNVTGAGGSSHAVAISPSGETHSSYQERYTPGATSSHSKANAVATATKTATSASTATGTIDNSLPAETLIYQFGTGESGLLTATIYQDIFIGSASANTFVLSNKGSALVEDADIITFFELDHDLLQLPDGTTLDDVSFEPIDLNNDGFVESTVVRLNQDNTILAVTLDALLTSPNVTETGDHTDAKAAVSAIPTTSVPEPAKWAGDNQSSTSLVRTVNYLIGTVERNYLVGTPQQDILLGLDDGDTFVLGTEGVLDYRDADIIVDFSLEDGDIIQLSSVLDYELVLEPVDLDCNGMLDSTSIRLMSGSVLAVVPGTVDALGNSLLSTQHVMAVNDHSQFAA
ncbi:MAG: hypothetical protein ACFB2W_17780 [Leptolyngbyaceae cyanobacterium]